MQNSVEAQSIVPIDTLIRRAIRGDQVSYSALYEQFANGVYRLCYSVLLNRDDAEDVAQESFVYAFKNLHKYDSNKSAFKTWLYTIAISRCRNLYNRNRLPHLDLADFWHMIAAPKTETPEAQYAQHDAQVQLEHALSRLQHRFREAIVLRYGHGLTYREIDGLPTKDGGKPRASRP
jgi:RNA polymerase sigma-70 factor, ECF subfamily